jgi:hypothetical protein
MLISLLLVASTLANLIVVSPPELIAQLNETLELHDGQKSM